MIFTQLKKFMIQTFYINRHKRIPLSLFLSALLSMSQTFGSLATISSFSAQVPHVIGNIASFTSTNHAQLIVASIAVVPVFSASIKLMELTPLNAFDFKKPTSPKQPSLKELFYEQKLKFLINTTLIIISIYSIWKNTSSLETINTTCLGMSILGLAYQINNFYTGMYHNKPSQSYESENKNVKQYASYYCYRNGFITGMKFSTTMQNMKDDPE